MHTQSLINTESGVNKDINAHVQSSKQGCYGTRILNENTDVGYIYCNVGGQHCNREMKYERL